MLKLNCIQILLYEQELVTSENLFSDEKLNPSFDEMISVKQLDSHRNNGKKNQISSSEVGTLIAKLKIKEFSCESLIPFINVIELLQKKKKVRL